MLKNVYNEAYLSRQPAPIFIVKPGEDSNRGNGIELTDDFYELRRLIDSR